MASSGIFDVNKLNEMLNQIAAPGFPLRWNPDSKVWYWSSNKKIPHYFYFSLTIKGIILMLEILLLAWNQQYSGILKTSQISAIILGLLLTSASLTFDFVMFDDGRELIVTCDWIYSYEDLIINPKKGGNPSYGKIGYLIAIGFAVSITLTHIAILLFLVFANLDPIHIVTMCFCPAIMLKRNVMPIIMIFRVIFWLQVALFSAVNLRTMFVMAMVQGFYKISLLKIMTTRGPTQDMIKLYKEQIIVLKIINSFDYKITVVGYGEIFLLICAATSGAMIGQERNKPMLIAISVCMIIMSLIVLHFLFLVGCAFFAFSKVVLRNWGDEVGTMMGQRAYLKRVVKSLPVIAMPIGDVGIVDQDMKMNYLDGLLMYVVDLMMARKNR